MNQTASTLYGMIVEQPVLFGVFVFWLGCCIGSFLNVCIWRIPRGESVVTAPSHCPRCGHQIRWYENIPLVSWLALRGKCSGCREPITIRYFIVELITGILFVLVFAKVVYLGWPLTFLPLYFGLIMLAVCTTFIDFKHLIIPDRITYPTMLLGVLSALAFPETWRQASHLLAGAYSIFTLLGCLAVMWSVSFLGEKIFRRDAFGLGDVKYITALGACLGPFATFSILLIASVIGTAAGVSLALARRQALSGIAIPFGPFLAVATCLWIGGDYFILSWVGALLPPVP
jgi:leader peptidase (prepilin peptidase)/N-methyltransferase